MAKAVINYNGTEYDSADFEFDLLVPLVNCLSRLTGLDGMQLVNAAPELKAVFASVPMYAHPTRQAAKADMVEILLEMFPTAPIREMTAGAATSMLKVLEQAFQTISMEDAEPPTSIDATSDNPESGDVPIIAIEPEPACPMPAPAETVVVADVEEAIA
jgi:predicted secreted protein